MAIFAALLTVPIGSSQEPRGRPAQAGEYFLAYAEPTPLPEPDPSAVDREIITFRIQKGDTLGLLLATAGIDPQEAEQAIEAIRKVFNPRRLKVGQEITVSYLRQRTGEERNSLRIVTIWLEADSYVEAIRLKEGRFVAHRTNRPSVEEEPVDPSAFTRIRVQKGDRLASLLEGVGVSPQATDAAVRALQRLFNPRKLKIDQQIFLSLDERDETGEAPLLLGLSLKLGERKYVTVVRERGDRYVARRTTQPAMPKAWSAAAANSPEPAPRAAALHEPEERAAGEDASGVAGTRHPPPRGLWAVQPKPSTTETEAPPGGEAEPLTKVVAIKQGDTLMEALLRTGCTRGEAHAAITAFSKVQSPRRLQVGQRVTLTFDSQAASDEKPRLATLSLELAPDREVRVTRDGAGNFVADEFQRPLEHHPIHATGVIRSNLYEAAMDAGMPVSVLMEMIHAFSFDVDFQREIQRGDRFEILFDRVYTTDGEFVGEGPLYYAALVLSGEKRELFRFELKDGEVDYFDRKGQSVHKVLMRTPIDGARLSSTYGKRKHPILGYTKMHRGVDFAAPKGTPIMAAGSGVIETAGRNGGYGEYIRIRHDSSYSTAYAHLSAYAKDIGKGRRVSQGQVIGYVGSTGRSTGPHLHYEVLFDGKQIDPLRVKLPTGEKLAGSELARFEREKERVLAQLQDLPVMTRLARSGELD